MARVTTLRTTGARLNGAELLRAKLEQLRFSAPDILRAGLEAGAEVLRSQMARRAGAPLASVIGVKVTETRAGRMVALVGPEKTKIDGMRAVSLAYWQEYGTRAHEIRPGAFKRVRRSRRKGGGTEAKSGRRLLATPRAIYGRRVKHPGAKARPFAVPTFEQDGARAAQTTGQAIWDRLQRTTGVA